MNFFDDPFDTKDTLEKKLEAASGVIDPLGIYTTGIAQKNIESTGAEKKDTKPAKKTKSTKTSKTSKTSSSSNSNSNKSTTKTAEEKVNNIRNLVDNGMLPSYYPNITDYMYKPQNIFNSPESKKVDTEYKDYKRRSNSAGRTAENARQRRLLKQDETKYYADKARTAVQNSTGNKYSTLGSKVESTAKIRQELGLDDDDYYSRIGKYGIDNANQWVFDVRTKHEKSKKSMEVRSESNKSYIDNGKEIVEKARINRRSDDCQYDKVGNQYRQKNGKSEDEYLTDVGKYGLKSVAEKEKTYYEKGQETKYNNDRFNKLNDYYRLITDGIINDDNTHEGSVSPKNKINIAFARDNADGKEILPDSHYKYVTDDQRKIYNYLLGKNVKEANEYLSLLDDDLHKKMNNDYVEQANDFADNHKILATGWSTVLSQEAGFQTLVDTAKQSLLETIDHNNYKPNSTILNKNVALAQRNALQGTVRDSVTSNIGKNAYDIVNSISNNALGVVMFQELYPVVMSVNAAGESTYSGLEKGLTKEQALKTGIAAGAIEYLTEKLFYDDIMDAVKSALTNGSTSKIRDILTSMVKNTGSEFGEEFTGALVDNVIDYEFNGDMSDFRLKVKSYISEGMSKDDAARKAFLDSFLIEPLKEGAAGAISGGVLGGAGTVINQAHFSETGKSVLQSNTGDAILQTALLADPSTETFKVATEISKGLNNGKRASNYVLGRLGYAMEQDGIKVSENTLLNQNYDNVPTQEDGGIAGTVAASKLKGATYKAIDTLAKASGTDVVVVDRIDYKNAKGETVAYDVGNGFTDPKNPNRIYISTNADKPLYQVVKHELTHVISNTDGGSQYISDIIKQAKAQNPEKFQSEIKSQRELYRAVTGKNLSGADATEEIAADLMMNAFNSFKSISEITEKNPTLAKSIYNGIMDIRAKMEHTFDTVKGENDFTFDGATAKAVDKAYKLWGMALRENGIETEPYSKYSFSLDNYDFEKAVNFFKNSEGIRRNEILQQFESGDVRDDYRISNLTSEELKQSVMDKRKEVSENILESRKFSLKKQNVGEPLSTEEAERFNTNGKSRVMIMDDGSEFVSGGSIMLRNNDAISKQFNITPFSDIAMGQFKNIYGDVSKANTEELLEIKPNKDVYNVATKELVYTFDKSDVDMLRKRSDVLKLSVAKNSLNNMLIGYDSDNRVSGFVTQTATPVINENPEGKKLSREYTNSLQKATYKKIVSEADARKDEFMYDGITNKETYKAAQDVIEESGVETATKDILAKAASDRMWTAQDTAQALALMAHYQTNSDSKTAVDIATAMRNKLTNAGQAVQAMRIIDKLTPEGKYITIMNDIAEINTNAKKEADEKIKNEKAKAELKEAEDGLNSEEKNITDVMSKPIQGELNEIDSKMDGFKNKQTGMAQVEQEIADAFDSGETDTGKIIEIVKSKIKKIGEIGGFDTNELESELDDLTQEYKNKADSGSSKSEIEKKISETKAKLKKLNSIDDIDTLKDELKNLTKQNEDIEKELEADGRLDLVKKIRGMKSSIGKLNSIDDIDTLKSIADDLTEEYDKLRSAVETPERKDLLESIIGLKQAIDRLKKAQSLGELQDIKSQLETEFNNAMGKFDPPDVQQLRKDISSIKSSIARLKKAKSKSQLDSEIAVLQSQYDSLYRTVNTPEVIALKSQIRGLKAKIAGLKKTGTNQQNIERLTAERNALIEDNLKNHVEKLYDKYKVTYIPQRLIDYIQNTAQTIDGINSVDDLVKLIMKQSKMRNTAASVFVKQNLKKEDIPFLKDYAYKQLTGMLLDQSHKGIWGGISAFQAMAHLSKPATANRNIVSNSAFGTLAGIANNVSMIPDVVIAGINKLRGNEFQRSVAADYGMFYHPIQQKKAQMEGARRKYLSIALDVSNGDVNKYSETRGRYFVDSPLRYLERYVSYVLGVPDDWSKAGVEFRVEGGYKRSKANNLSDSEISEIANEEAKYRTFQDDNAVSTVLNHTKKVLNIHPVYDENGKRSWKTGGDFGVGDIVLKYTQVPGALIDRVIDFSPAGTIDVILAAAQAKQQGMNVRNQRRLSLAIGRALTGSAAIAAFMCLAKLGVITDGDDDEDKIVSLKKSEGLTGHQLNLTALERLASDLSSGHFSNRYKLEQNDLLLSVDFLDPIDYHISIGSEIANAEDMSAQSVWDILSSRTWDEIMDIPVLQTLRTATQIAQSGGDLVDIAFGTMSSSATGFIPSPIRAATIFTDEYQRNSYKENNPFDKSKNIALSSIPGLSDLVPAKVNPFGELLKRGTDSKTLDVFNSYINPGYIREYVSSDLSQDLYRLGKLNIDAVPRIPPTSWSYDGEKFTAYGKDYEKWSVLLGKTTKKAMLAHMATEYYKNGTEQEQADDLAEAEDEAYKEAKKQWYNEKHGVFEAETEKSAYEIELEGAKYRDSARDFKEEKGKYYIDYDEIKYEVSADLARDYTRTKKIIESTVYDSVTNYKGALNQLDEFKGKYYLEYGDDGKQHRKYFDMPYSEYDQATKDKILDRIKKIAKATLDEKMKDKIVNGATKKYQRDETIMENIENGDYSKNAWVEVK